MLFFEIRIHMENSIPKVNIFTPSYGCTGRGELYNHYYQQGRKIRLEDLEDLGYRLTARHLVINIELKLFELLQINSSKNVKCCFLAPGHRLSGVIICNAFHEHKALLRSSIKNYRRQEMTG